MVDTGFTSPIALTPEPHCEVMTLPSLFAYEDMAEVFAGIADPAVVANLTAVSRSLAESFATPHLWASQLVRRFEVERSEAAQYRELAAKIAIDPDPGMPKISVGTSPPPSFALFELSGAITPRMSPWPNCDLSFAVCTADP